MRVRFPFPGRLPSLPGMLPLFRRIFLLLSQFPCRCASHCRLLGPRQQAPKIYLSLRRCCLPSPCRLREHTKRLCRLGSATGACYVRLKAQLNLKMDKYRKVARVILIPRAGNGLGDELERARVSIWIVKDRSEAADRALKEHMVETMERRRVSCLVLVLDDTRFVGVIKEPRMRYLKTVVVGDDGNGALKRFDGSVRSILALKKRR